MQLQNLQTAIKKKKKLFSFSRLKLLVCEQHDLSNRKCIKNEEKKWNLSQGVCNKGTKKKKLCNHTFVVNRHENILRQNKLGCNVKSALYLGNKN